MSQQIAFLSGRVLLAIPVVESWLEVITDLAAVASGPLESQLTTLQTQFNTLLTAPTDPTIAPGLIIVPITYVNDLKKTLAVYEHEFNGYPPNPNLYLNVTYEVDSVFIQYSSFFYNGGLGKLFFY